MTPVPAAFPEESGLDEACSLWFVFALPEATIRVWGNAAGFERVYVNDELVSAHWSYRLLSVHEWTFGADTYQVRGRTSFIKDCALECSLVRNGELVHVQRAEYRDPEGESRFPWQPVLAGVLVGLVVGTFEWPVWVPVVLIALLLGVRASKRLLLRFMVVEQVR